MNISELTGEALDFAVAQCEGHDVEDPTWWADFGDESRYSTDWAQGGPIIEREMIELIPQTPALWDAMYRGQHIPNDGPTPLIAAMRCYVASKLGATL